MAGRHSVHYERRGEGPLLLLVQGASATLHMWGDALLAELACDHTVVTYDHPGVGASTAPAGPFTTADLADTAAVLLDELGWVQASVLGVSMGGMVAQQLAVRHPERVARLVLGATRAGPAEEPDRLAAVAAVAHVPGDPEATARAMYRLSISEAFAAGEVAEAVYTGAVAHPVDPRVAALQMVASRQHDAWSSLGAVTAPTLVVHGDQDRVISPAEGRALAAAIPRARFAEVPAGHLFWLEQPERTARLVTDFLAP